MLKHWRESCFFVAHRPDSLGDVLILTTARHPSPGGFDCYQMGRIDGELIFARHTRPGSASIEVMEPGKTIRLQASGVDLTWSARTRPYTLPQGTVSAGGRLVWDQQHTFQSGWFDGSYLANGERREVNRWWGQRDQSSGIRDHQRCPMWMWLAIQLSDGMLGVWCWEHPNGEHAYTEGCWAPADLGQPVPVTGFTHDLSWLDTDGCPVDYGRDGSDVAGLAGRVRFTLADGRRVGIEGDGTWNVRYGRRGGGQHHLAVITDDGRRGTAIYEITGVDHHYYFPISRARP